MAFIVYIHKRYSPSIVSITVNCCQLNRRAPIPKAAFRTC